mmetsp:Transcript_109223/g.296138  ORF Transcript_109223/g.296138 Transcript_109223/m.296138 type:complete len:140 (-) Transcript_109223:207-626(-)
MMAALTTTYTQASVCMTAASSKPGFAAIISATAATSAKAARTEEWMPANAMEKQIIKLGAANGDQAPGTTMLPITMREASTAPMTKSAQIMLEGRKEAISSIIAAHESRTTISVTSLFARASTKYGSGNNNHHRSRRLT